MSVKDYNKKDLLKKIAVILLTGISGGLALNYFLTPAKVFSAGMTGIAQIVAAACEAFFGITINTGLCILLLNIPVFILGFLKLGKDATFLSFLNVLSVSFFAGIIPVGKVTDDVLMNAIVGGCLLAVGAGLSLKYGFTTGGLDIISLILSKTTGKTVGNYMMLLNGLIVLVAGFFFDWGSALYTIITIFTMGTVVDMIHTSHQKMTAFVVTREGNQIAKAIQENLVRGLTLVPSYGGFSHEEKTTIMIVVTRYELYSLNQIVRDIDKDAFINIVPTQTVMGSFLNEDEQKTFKKVTI